MQARRSAALPRPWWIAAGLLLVTCACGVTSGDRPSVSSESARPATSTTPPAEYATKPAGAGGKQRRPGERVLATAYVTGYSVHDNSPPGSARIAYPNERHEVAAGVGSYDDPITVAVGWHRKEGTQWPVRSRFYLPYLRKYAVVEDQCGDRAQDGPCYQLDEAPDGATTWIDVWAGGEGRARAATERCLTRITGIHLVIHRPAKGYPVNRGEVAAACDRDEFWPDRRPAVPGG
ncbi:hypothetical protein ABN028_30380 [Actinopolymorpha sp. B17G11]|uniref:hypothetical protein n=1 Tax=unclassified Actinopolymorpha TaxID=2627063 RepID=UPI0032D8DAAB